MDEKFTMHETIDQSYVLSKDERRANLESALLFGIPFLDESQGGILPTDLIGIVADTGAGKSEVAIHIALTNVLKGKKVYLFALEAEKHEVSSRIAYRLFANKFFADKMSVYSTQKPNFLDWQLGRQERLMAPYEDQVREELKKLDSLVTIYRGENFGIEDIEKNILLAKHDADLLVIDHLHYFDFNDDNENKAYKQIIRKIRHLSQEYRKPVILVVHCRKRGRKDRTIIPEAEDVHGSSDIPKTLTRLISLAPAWGLSLMEGNSYRFSTYIKCEKIRYDGARRRFCGLVVFNARENKYEDKYKIGTISVDGQEWLACDQDNKPYWAKGAT